MYVIRAVNNTHQDEEWRCDECGRAASVVSRFTGLPTRPAGWAQAYDGTGRQLHFCGPCLAEGRQSL